MRIFSSCVLRMRPDDGRTVSRFGVAPYHLRRKNPDEEHEVRERPGRRSFSTEVEQELPDRAEAGTFRKKLKEISTA